MDLINSPINNISNENENLIIQSEPDGIQNENIDEYYPKKNTNHQIKIIDMLSIGFFVVF